MLSADYAQTAGIVLDFVQQLTETERDGILGGNCARIYGVVNDQASLLTSLRMRT
jgi:predicted TIM-barrel fold metal-dependent hydrolase